MPYILDSLRQGKHIWITHIGNIIKKKSSIEHSIIQIKPNEAGRKENHFGANWHFQNAAKKNKTL